MREADAAYAWLSQEIAAATSLNADTRIWKLTHPGDAWPVVVCSPAALVRVSMDGGRNTALWRQEWNILAIDRGTGDTAIDSLAEAIGTRLKYQRNQTTPVLNCNILSCVAGAEIDFTDRDSDGITYRHRGGLFTLLVNRN